MRRITVMAMRTTYPGFTLNLNDEQAEKLLKADGLTGITKQTNPEFFELLDNIFADEFEETISYDLVDVYDEDEED